MSGRDRPGSKRPGDTARPTLTARRGGEEARRGIRGGAPQPPAGLAARLLAGDIVGEVLDARRPLDEVLSEILASGRGLALAPRDRGLARLIAATVIRRTAAIDALLAEFLEKPLGDRHAAARNILRIAAAQMLYLETPAHAAINLAVAHCRRHPATGRFDKLANAVLRKVVMQGRALLEDIDQVRLAVPDFMWRGWVAAYGEETARRIAEASLVEAPLDLSLKEPASAADWAGRLEGVALASGTVRLTAGGRVEDRKGYDEGAWWVQDAAAALPARLFGADPAASLAGLSAVDLCAAPGGKTMQLAARGARTVAVDLSASRIERIAENLARLGLAAELVTADAGEWRPDRTFDCVLLDAPCTATGTIRRHPDILHLKRADDLKRLVPVQARLLAAAANLVSPGGELVYATCSLEPEEGVRQVEAFLAANPAFERHAVAAGTGGIAPEWVTPEGDLRTLPFHNPTHLDPTGDPERRGMDGFFAARLRRRQT